MGNWKIVNEHLQWQWLVQVSSFCWVVLPMRERNNLNNNEGVYGQVGFQYQLNLISFSKSQPGIYS